MCSKAHVMTETTQLTRIKGVLAKGSASIKIIADQLAGVPVPSIRRHLGQGEKKGIFTRIDKGVYALKTESGENRVYIHHGFSQDIIPKLVEAGYKYDSVFLDPAYFSWALIGGSRGIKQYGFIHPPEFKLVMNGIKSLLKSDDSHVYLMLSGAPSAQKDMKKYLDVVEEEGFKLVEEGNYRKFFANGKPVTNVRGKVAEPERLYLFSLSGTVRTCEEPVQMEFNVQRPSIRNGYATQKAESFIERIVLQSTFENEHIFDPFAGSGVVGKIGYLKNRFVTMIEALEDTIDNYIVPRFAY